MNHSLGRLSNFFLTRARRRALVIAVLLAPASGLLLSAPQSEPFSTRNVLGMLLLMAAGFGLILLLHIASHSATNPRALLDERGRAERGRAYEIAYWVLASGLTIALVYANASESQGFRMPSNRAEWLITAGVVAYILITLPASTAAWNEPDVILDEDDGRTAGRPIVYSGRNLGSIHRLMLGFALAASLILIVAQATGLSDHPPGISYVLAGVVTGCLLQLLPTAARRRSS